MSVLFAVGLWGFLLLMGFGLITAAGRADGR